MKFNIQVCKPYCTSSNVILAVVEIVKDRTQLDSTHIQFWQLQWIREGVGNLLLACIPHRDTGFQPWVYFQVHPF